MRQRMQQQQGATDTASASGAGAVRQDSVFFKTLLCPKCALSLRHIVNSSLQTLQHCAVLCQANFERQYQSVPSVNFGCLLGKAHSKAQASSS